MGRRSVVGWTLNYLCRDSETDAAKLEMHRVPYVRLVMLGRPSSREYSAVTVSTLPDLLYVAVSLLSRSYKVAVMVLADEEQPLLRILSREPDEDVLDFEPLDPEDPRNCTQRDLYCKP